MLERHSHWEGFLEFAQNDQVPDEKVSRYTGVGVTAVRCYRKMLQGRDYALRNGNIPPKLRKSVVAFRFRHHTIRWIESRAVLRARELYEEGTHELCQGLCQIDGQEAWVLYCIERRRPVAPRQYFTLEPLP